MTPLERITARVNRNGDVNDPTTPQPLLSIDEFFDGNEATGSIGCNLIPTPEPADFYAVFKHIASRPDVADVRVQVSMFDDPEWPFSDTVWIITSAQPQEVATWFTEEMRPDECSSGWSASTITEVCRVPLDMQPIACWWD